ncbi:hypothetical protein Rumeso_03464 [Rubellimicrobium mesophilum DSM 19309]|uniref:DUF4440 domain-containing protein n=1 Tax=Rubellimicrobium mesophilum DSM 19309 TaxID=442562 RepID=A0A017HKD4_9RHOB|nr:nuclear transport factor 2 family protein [Rubellimicrobium mesophilum]EYD74952.1 hypothetical protein Rumeso_03464 [Rubellimicrobium mesophilum DSM 19309]
MRTRTRIGLIALAVSTASLLGGGMAMAHDEDLQAHVDDFEQRFEAAVAAGDWATLGSMFAEDATYLPETGGVVEGREAIQAAYGESGATGLDIRSSQTKMIGEGLGLDLGTYTVTVAGEAGDMDLEGEYVVVFRESEAGLEIVSLTTFPVRQAPDVPA